jgi:nitroreductase
MTTHAPVSSASLLAHLNWRYATKAFDTAKTISPEDWKALEEALILTPSSFGLQPWKFIVITDKEMKAKLKAHSWNQSQVTDCSHYVVFASLKKICEADIDKFLAHTVKVRGGSLEALKGYRGMMTGFLIQGAGSKNATEWAVRQTYIALGNFMTAAALLRIDTCPMEGFVPAEYDKILGLEAKGLTAAVCCAAGYRRADDKHAGLPKIRFHTDEMIERI